MEKLVSPTGVKDMIRKIVKIISGEISDTIRMYQLVRCTGRPFFDGHRANLRAIQF